MEYDLPSGVSRQEFDKAVTRAKKESDKQFHKTLSVFAKKQTIADVQIAEIKKQYFELQTQSNARIEGLTAVIQTLLKSLSEFTDVSEYRSYLESMGVNLNGNTV